MTEPTPTQWLDVLLVGDRAARERMAAKAIDDAATSSACWTDGHDSRLEHHAAQRAAFVKAVDELLAALPELSNEARPGVRLAIIRLAATLNYHPEAH